MPRKTRKSCLLKPQLVFVEPPLNGARHQYGPQVMGALNPKSFISDEQRQNNTSSSWVSPQFDQLQLPGRCGGKRGRKRDQRATSTLNTSSHVRKTSVCKYPPLSFGTAVQLHGHNHAKARTIEGVAGALEDRQLPGRDPQSMSRDPDAEDTETPRRALSLRKRTVKSLMTVSGVTEAAGTSSRLSETLRIPVAQVARKNKSSVCSSQTPALVGSHTPDIGNVFTPPNVETPEMPQSDPSTSILHLLWPPSQPKTPPQTQGSGLLVTDTPERDYGVKVTWRRRKGLMRLLMDRGQLPIT